MTEMPEKTITLFVCGLSCEHVFDGPIQPLIDEDGEHRGATATCSKCGALAINVSLMEMD
jgi:hypothetical protein